MNWIVIVGNTVVLKTTEEAIARAKAEESASAGAAAVLAQEVQTCAPADAAPVWSP